MSVPYISVYVYVCVCFPVEQRCYVVYGSESGDRIVECVSTAADVLQSIVHGLGCILYLYNEHNVCMGHSDLVENCRRPYVVKRKPL